MVRSLPLLLALLLTAPAGAQEPMDVEPGGAAAVSVPVAPPPADADDFQIVFSLQAGNEVVLEQVAVDLDLPSGMVTVPLVDDGSLAEDLAWDGVYVGIWRGPYLRWAHVRLLGGAEAAPEVFAEGLERFHDQRRASVAWRLIPGDHRFVGVRTAATPLTGTDDVTGRVELLASFGWAALLAVFLATLAVRARESRR